MPRAGCLSFGMQLVIHILAPHSSHIHSRRSSLLKASGEVLSFQYVQYLTVLPSLLIKLLIPPSFTPDAFYLLTLEVSKLILSKTAVKIY